MLLNQTFKTGGLSVGGGSSTIARRSDAVAVSLNPGRRVAPMSKPVRASSATGGESSPGWLESKMDKVTNFVGKKLHGDGKSAASATEPTVEYHGTAIVVKKLTQLDIVDRVADLKDDASELLQGKHVSVQLLSGTIDPSTGEGKLSGEVKFTGWVTLFDSLTAEQIKFETKFTVPKSFGTPVAIVVRNTHPNEFLLESFKLDLADKSVAHYITNSWVYNTEKTKPIGPRIFFHNKAYLPHETPEALKELREKELIELRGDGTKDDATRLRVQSDRIYDYAPYDDLGKPDEAKKLKKTAKELDRPPLGGNKDYPFPRRIRTNRPRTKHNDLTESRVDGNFYVPSDERFDYRKESDNKADLLRAGGHIAKTKIGVKFGKTTFETLDEVKALYAPKGDKTSNQVLPGKADPAAEAAAVRGGMRFISELMSERADGEQGRTFRFPIPQIIKESDNAWATDSEFARENLAGFNPIMIKRVTEFPIRSKLPAEYGKPESAITAEHIEGKLEGLSIEQALSEKKLFTVDHHDTFLPWVALINALENSKTYASRVLFFLCKDETLKVLAIELVLPKENGKEKISKVYTPPVEESTKVSLWTLAKAHAINNEMTMHQAVSHFTLCHAVTEPAILSAHRNLSKMHPIMQLMFPHFKHTIQVNSTARMNLLPTDGTIEQIYTPREYVVRMASAYYRDNWTFESNALPQDLIKRGMAEADPNSKYGVKLAIEDYPYAADGLELWNAMKEWHREYINIFYKDDAAVTADTELAKWWDEYRNKGHEDMKDAQGWPALEGKESLNEILTTVVWICTAMHAPINFGQYDYAAWMPQHPAITRKHIPEPGSKDWEDWQKNPEKFWLSMISDTDTTCTAMAVFEVVAAHAPDEEYIGQRSEGWTASEQVQGAFDKYVQKLHAIDDNIVKRNSDKNLKNRCGVGNFPFQLLRPFSQPGVTAMGVPNSITV